jgi:hypothetical protein
MQNSSLSLEGVKAKCLNVGVFIKITLSEALTLL